MKSLKARIARLEQRLPEESWFTSLETLTWEERDVLIEQLKLSIAEHERTAAADGLSPEAYSAGQPSYTAAEMAACAKNMVALVRQKLAERALAEEGRDASSPWQPSKPLVC